MYQPPGTQTKFATDQDSSGAHVQHVKVVDAPSQTGGATEATLATVSSAIAALNTAANAIKTAAETLAGRTINTGAISGTVAVSNLPATQTVSGTVTVANPTAQGLTDAQLRAASVPVSVGNFPATQPVSAAVLPLPTGAASEATLDAARTLLASLIGALGNHSDPAVDGRPGMVGLVARRRDSDLTANVSDGDLAFLSVDENSRLKVSTQPATYATVTGDITAIQASANTPVAGATVYVNCDRYSNISLQCSGTFAGYNCTFEVSNNSTNGTDGTWGLLQVAQSSANTAVTATGALSASPAYLWEASVNAYKWFRVRCTARTSGTQTWTLVPGTYASETVPIIQVSATQPVSGTVTANQGTLATPTALNFNSAANTNLTAVKASAGTLYNLTFASTSASTRYVKLFNKASAPVPASDVPIMTIVIAAGASFSLNFGVLGHRFATGIAMSVTGGAGDTDTTAIAANEIRILGAYV